MSEDGVEAIHLDWTGGRPVLSVAAAPALHDLVTVVSSASGTAVVVGWVGSVRDREAGARRLLDDFASAGPTGCEPVLPVGDYAAVVVGWDRIGLLRDEQARVPLFFAVSGGRVTAVGTSLRRLGRRAELEPRYFCRCLPGNLAQPRTRLTPFAGVYRLLGGEVVELSPTGRIQRRCQAGCSASDAPAVSGPEPGTVRTGARLLRGALQSAVGRRVGRVTACHVSGGTDSTSVALLAAQSMAAGYGVPGELVLLAGRFGGGELAEEQPYIDEAIAAIRRQAPAARPLVVDADSIADFDDFRQHAGEADEPYPHAFRAPFWAKLHCAASASGCDSLLTGCGADPVADANPLHLHALARAGHLRRLMRGAEAWAAGERGLRETLFRYVVQPTLPLTAERTRAVLWHRGTVLGGLGAFGRPRWLRAGFARRYGYRRAAAAESRFAYGRRPEVTLYDAANLLTAPDPLSWVRAQQDGFLLSHPFLDREVVATMCQLSTEMVLAPGRPKAVLREAMADLLPPRIRDRTAKIPFDGLYARGLRRHGDALIEMCRSARHPLITEMFEVSTLCRAVEEASLGVGDAFAWDRMNASLAVVAWLEGLEHGAADAGAVLSVPLRPDPPEGGRSLR